MMQIFKKVPLIEIMINGTYIIATGALNAQEADVIDSIPYNTPQENIEVYKEYDENGNITRYDSVYSWSYYGNGEIPFDMDSVWRGFHPDFSRDDIFKDDPFFIDPLDFNFSFFNDSIMLFGYPFDNDFGYIRKMMEEHRRMMEELFDNHFPFDGMYEFKPVTPPDDDFIQPEDKKERGKKEKKIELKNTGHSRKLFI